MIYNVGNPIIKLPFGDGFCSTHKKSDVGMVYEWVYQIIYDDHNPWIHYTYLIILSLYIGDYHAGWS